MSRSSIFSFSSLPSRPVISGAGLLAVAMVILFRGVLAVMPPTFDRTEDPRSKTFRMFEVRAAANKATPEPVVILGTSRLGVAIAESAERHLSMGEHAVVDYSHPSNTFWWSATFLRRNPSVWHNARVAVIDVVPSQLYASTWFSETSAVFLRYASWNDRLRVDDPADRLSAVSEWFLPTQSQTKNLSTWAAAIHDTYRGPAAIQEPLAATMYLGNTRTIPRDTPAPVEDRPTQTLHNNTAENFKHYLTGKTVNEIQRQSIIWMTENVPEDCTLLLIMPPVLRHPEEILIDSPEMLERYTAFHDFLTGLTSDRVSVRFYEDPGEFQLTAKHFVDGIHYSPEGVEKAGAIIADAIREAAPTLE